MSRVLVLNASYEPVNVCTVRRAVVLLLKQKAEALEHSGGQVRSETRTLALPVVIRLLVYVHIPRDTRRRITRRAVLARDGWACQYCGSRTRLTVDHVRPRAKGGVTEWTNVVAACVSCNTRKGDRLVGEASMTLAREPRPPGPVVFVYLTVPRVPASWAAYLPA